MLCESTCTRPIFYLLVKFSDASLPTSYGSLALLSWGFPSHVDVSRLKSTIGTCSLPTRRGGNQKDVLDHVMDKPWSCYVVDLVSLFRPLPFHRGVNCVLCRKNVHRE